MSSSIFQPKDQEWVDRCSILHTFICTAERTSTFVAANLLFTFNRSDIAAKLLKRLHAVLYIQNGRVLWYHKSFPDFLFDQNRSKDFWCDQAEHHRRLTESCFRIMNAELRFNIANIPSSFTLDQQNTELAHQLNSHVQAIAQEASQVEPDDLNAIVSRVVDYLQTSEYSIKQIEHHQILDSNLVSNELQAFLRLGQLIDLADTGNPLAAAEVAAIAEIMGQLLNLPAWQVKRLRLASLLHRIAPHSVNVQYGEAPSCPLIPAAQVLRTMPRLSAIAQIINHFSEHWDGSGEPAGLMGETIPLESRILGLEADFQQRFTHLSQSHTREEALSTALA